MNSIRSAFSRILAAFLTVCVVAGAYGAVFERDVNAASSPLDAHGKLSVNGTHIVDSRGKNFQLRGISTHGIQWEGDPYSDVGGTYISEASFRTLRDDWGANAVRLAMYVEKYHGYCTGGDKEMLRNKIELGVNTARNLGMYAIIDWHVLNFNPNNRVNDAIEFFRIVSEKYKDYDNVLYEICNEPNNCSWDDIKNYANQVIPVIRQNDPDAIIIVGTPTWSQLGAAGHTNEVADNPLTGYSNIVYTLHFYCAEPAHIQYLHAKLDYAVSKGLPVFVSEFGLSEAGGNGSINTSQADEWLSQMDRYGVSYFCWSLSHKNESASLLQSWCNTTSGWSESELSEAGRYIRNAYRARMEDYSFLPSGSSRPVVVNPTIDPEDRAFVEDFVERLYVNMLGRASDSEGKNNWIRLLAGDVTNGDAVAEGFYFSSEFRRISASLSNRDFVTRMYITILGRNPDEDGLNFWINRLDTGAISRDAVFYAFLGSPEWQRICRDNDIISGHYQVGRFVDRLYRIVLGREPDPDGRAGWIDAIVNRNESAYVVAYGFVFSNEFISRNYSDSEFVTILYNTVLDRAPDQSGYNDWLNVLSSGQSREHVYAGFLQSPEFVTMAESYGIRAY